MPPQRIFHAAFQCKSSFSDFLAVVVCLFVFLPLLISGETCAAHRIGVGTYIPFVASSSLGTGTKQAFPVGWQPRPPPESAAPPCLPPYYEPIGPPWKCRPHSILGSWPQLWDSVPAPHCLKPVGLSVKTKDESSDWCNDFRYRQLSELG